MFKLNWDLIKKIRVNTSLMKTRNELARKGCMSVDAFLLRHSVRSNAQVPQ